MQTYFYIDDAGKEQKYVGQIYVVDNAPIGVITSVNKEVTKYSLTYNEAVEGVEGYTAYFTDENGNKYTNNIKRDGNTYYYTTVSTDNIDLIYHAAIPAQEKFFTYKDSDDNDKIYTGKTKYNKMLNSYFASN